MNKRKHPLVFTVKWRDFYILWIWKFAFIWITKAEHKNTNSFIEFWNAKYAKALVFGSYGIGIGHAFEFE